MFSLNQIVDTGRQTTHAAWRTSNAYDRYFVLRCLLAGKTYT